MHIWLGEAIALTKTTKGWETSRRDSSTTDWFHRSRRRTVGELLLRPGLPEYGSRLNRHTELHPIVRERFRGQVAIVTGGGNGIVFAHDSGQRSRSIVFDMRDTSQIPTIAEDWFLAFNVKKQRTAVRAPQLDFCRSSVGN